MVGVGASAGGLDACRKLIEALPPTPGVAIILVQHLDPTHESMMVDLLAGHTTLTVVQASEGLRIEADHLYVIPPGAYLSATQGALHLSPPQARHGARLPFDFLLNSLAVAFGANAACVILSGTGGDGSLGLEAIKTAGGLVIAQEPDEAGYDGMPRSAIATGRVDLVLPAARIAETLVRRGRGLPVESTQEERPSNEPGASRLSEIIDLLRAHTTHDFRAYKNGTLERRIERRMALAGIEAAQAGDYVERLRNDPEELEGLAKDLLINVTAFFRDPKVFDLLAEDALPPLVRGRTIDQPPRLWVIGCSTGEEPYSLAMLLIEALEKAGSPARPQIFASDVDADAVAAAREALYPSSIEAVVSRERLDRFFIREGEHYRISGDLRALVVFTVQDVLADPPFSRLDLVSCRNLLIYLRPEAQAKVVEICHFALRPGGLLLLGNSETIIDGDPGFEVVSKSARLYRQRGRERSRPLLFGPAPEETTRPARRTQATAAGGRRAALAQLCERSLLETYAPAAVLINPEGECLFSMGPTDRYLRVAPGEPNHELLAMARDGVRGPLRLAVQRALYENVAVTLSGGEINPNGTPLAVTLQARPVTLHDEPLLLVTFTDAPRPTPRPAAAAEGVDPNQASDLERELESAKRELREAIHNLEISSEEQKAINEEARSATEEYQATNEELLASKEELQSMNEELTALNSQLQETLERQRTTANDLQNVLNSTRVATIFLDNELRIRLFTPASRDLFKVITTDVGRPLADLQPLAADETLLQDARVVLTTSATREREIEAPGGAWFRRRIMPYRTQEDRVEGVVITFTDVSEARRAGEDLQAARRLAEKANAAKSRFLAAASHDLRQPLQTLALVHGLLAKSVESDRARKLVARLDDTLGAMTGMLNALLDINQIEAGTVRAEPVRFPIANLLDRLKGEFAYHAQAQKLGFHVVSCDLWVTSDPRLLELMLRNLIANALKYTRTGKVLVGCRRRAGQLRVEVWDTGIGIPSSELNAIFEEFHQLDNAARERSLGLGLGLSIVRSLGNLLDHHVEVRSKLGRGSMFAIEIALEDGGRPPASVAAALKSVDPTTGSDHGRGWILVIEDDPALRELLEFALKHEGHRVTAVSDGVPALDLVSKGVITPDLILADYNLPNGLNGLQVMARVRAHLGRDIPVIMLTGDVSTEALREIALEKCAQLSKPAKLHELGELIRQALTPHGHTVTHAPPDQTPAVATSARAAVPGDGPVIYLVDDDLNLRQMLREVLEDDGRTVQDFGDCESFLAAWRPDAPACLLIDAYLPTMSGLDLLRQLKSEGRHLPALMITGRSDVSMAVEAMKAGAADFIEKPVGRDELLAAIDHAMEGARDSSNLTARRSAASAQMARLTERQREIMDMVLAGQPSKNIAADLGISQRTVENHRAAIMKKTGVRSLPALARLALTAAATDTTDNEV